MKGSEKKRNKVKQEKIQKGQRKPQDSTRGNARNGKQQNKAGKIKINE